MMYNLPLKMILDKLTDIDNKLALLVDCQPIDMEREMEMEIQKEKVEDECEGQSKIYSKATGRRKVSKKEANKA